MADIKRSLRIFILLIVVMLWILGFIEPEELSIKYQIDFKIIKIDNEGNVTIPISVPIVIPLDLKLNFKRFFNGNSEPLQDEPTPPPNIQDNKFKQQDNRNKKKRKRNKSRPRSR